VMLSSDIVIRYADQARSWPWRKFAIVVVCSFLSASFVSSLIGWGLMGKTSKPETVNNDSDVPFEMAPTTSETKAVVAVILARNLFNSQGTFGDVSDKPATSEIPKSQLPIKLIGIIYGGTPFDGIAMIENSQNKSVNSFMVGEQVSAEAVLEEIQTDLILIKNNGQLEFVALDSVELRRSSRTGGGKKKQDSDVAGQRNGMNSGLEYFKEDGFERKGKSIEMSAEYKNTLLGPGFATVLQDAKASPNMVDGVLKGWRMDQIKPESFYAKSGMQNGDVALEINGVVLSDAGQSVKLLKDLKNESEIDIKINRNGVDMTISLKVR
jgi:general secretion pathway protein C